MLIREKMFLLTSKNNHIATKLPRTISNHKSQLRSLQYVLVKLGSVISFTGENKKIEIDPNVERAKIHFYVICLFIRLLDWNSKNMSANSIL